MLCNIPGEISGLLDRSQADYGFWILGCSQKSQDWLGSESLGLGE